MLRDVGSEKVRHIEVHQLLLQDRVARGDLRIRKVDGKENPADARTKYVDRAKLEKHMQQVGLHNSEGRHAMAPVLAEE